MQGLQARNIVKIFPGGVRALDDVSFEARRARVLTLLGPSGCGKSTLLRIVAGLEQATSGTLALDGERLEDVPVGRRRVGFVFQNYALYPHLSVAGNLALALEVQKVAHAERDARVREIADLLGIGSLLDRRPGQLSGGQQQRVALGRALVKHPRLYLLDEPLSNLDALLREDMRSELKRLFRRVDATVIYVTHDQTEAMSLSDDVAVMCDGKILQCAPPLELYARPAELFVATFVGSPRMTVWRGRRDGSTFACRGVTLTLPPGLGGQGDAYAGIRPEDVEVSDRPLDGGWEGAITVAEPLGARTLLTLRVGDEDMRVLADPRSWPERVWVRWPMERIHWFDAASGARLERDAASGSTR